MKYRIKCQFAHQVGSKNTEMKKSQQKFPELNKAKNNVITRYDRVKRGAMIEFRFSICFAFFIFLLCIAGETTGGIIRMKLFGKLVQFYFVFFFIFMVIITIVQPKTTIKSLTFLKKKMWNQFQFDKLALAICADSVVY